MGADWICDSIWIVRSGSDGLDRIVPVREKNLISATRFRSKGLQWSTRSWRRWLAGGEGGGGAGVGFGCSGASGAPPDSWRRRRRSPRRRWRWSWRLARARLTAGQGRNHGGVGDHLVDHGIDEFVEKSRKGRWEVLCKEVGSERSAVSSSGSSSPRRK